MRNNFSNATTFQRYQLLDRFNESWFGIYLVYSQHEHVGFQFDLLGKSTSISFINKISITILPACLIRSTKCEYMDGSCLASPRWVSLLVAEIYYPDATFPNPAAPAASAASPTRGPVSQNRSPVQGNSPPSVRFETDGKKFIFLNYAKC